MRKQGLGGDTAGAFGHHSCGTHPHPPITGGPEHTCPSLAQVPKAQARPDEISQSELLLPKGTGPEISPELVGTAQSCPRGAGAAWEHPAPTGR